MPSSSLDEKGGHHDHGVLPSIRRPGTSTCSPAAKRPSAVTMSPTLIFAGDGVADADDLADVADLLGAVGLVGQRAVGVVPLPSGEETAHDRRHDHQGEQP